MNRKQVSGKVKFEQKWAIMFYFLLFSACAHGSLEKGRINQSPEGQVAIAIQFSSSNKDYIFFELASLQLLRSDGEFVTLSIKQGIKAQPDQRQVLFRKTIPLGTYQKIGLLFAQPVVHHQDVQAALECSSEYVYLDYPFTVTPQGMTNLDLNLEVTSQKKGVLQGEEPVFSPRLTRGKKLVALKSLMLYVTNSGDNTVTVIDRLSNSTVAVIQVGKEPKGIAVNPEGAYVYVANAGSNTLSIIDTMTNEVEETIDLPLGLSPSSVAVSPDGKYIFTANTESDNVTVIDSDLKRSVDTLEVGHRPIDLEVSPSGKFLYVTNKGSNDLYLIDLEDRENKEAIKLPMRSEPWGLAVTKEKPSNYDVWGVDRLFVVDHGSSSLLSFIVNVDGYPTKEQIEKSKSTFQTEYGPAEIACDEDNHRLYISNYRDQSVGRFLTSFSGSVNIQENRYQVGASPIGLVLDAERNYLYVVNSGEGTISIIDLRQEYVVDTLRVGESPYGVTLIKR